MSYDSKAQDKFLNNAIELIVFRTGPENYIYSSTHTDPITIGGNVYLPFPFDRGERKISNAFEDDGVKIIVLPSHPICDHYKTMPTDYDVSVMVRQGYISDAGEPYSEDFDTDYPILCFGWIGSVEFETESGEMTLSVVTIGDTLSAPTLSRHFQQSCPLRLYGPKCKAVRKYVEPLVAELANARLTMPEGWAAPYTPYDFIGGIISFIMPDNGATQYRMISRADETGANFVGSAIHLSGYASIQVAIGCPHILDACRDLHDNSRRYGGFPWQPLENPVNKSIR